MPGRSETELLHHGGRAGDWGSLGWWAPLPDDGAGAAPDYYGACAALARQVGRAAGLQPGARVLSVACGAGEELRLWVQHFHAAEVVGVELAPARGQRATALTAGLPGVRVIAGSGSALLALGLPAAGFDHVLCVDAAYHLQPRLAFLQAACALLRPGGTLACTDLVTDEDTRGWRPALLALGARACGLPADSLCSGPAQLQRLRDAGFIEPQLQRVDEAVLGGYTRFVARQGREWRRAPGRQGGPGGPWQAGWRRVACTAWLIPPCRAAGLGYAMLSARKPFATGAAASASATASAERTALSSSGTPASA
jgi:SAM-dependent methyltransferase